MKFQNQVICINGAGRGIGPELARAFADEGAQVVLLDAEAGQQAHMAFEPVDMRDAASVQRAVRSIVARFGRIDVWINNAGASRVSSAVNLSLDEWDADIGAMLSGAFYCANVVGRVLIEQKCGNLINLTLVHGLFAQKGHAAFAAANAGLIMLTKVLASEWGEHGVRVNAIAAGIVTEMHQSGPISEETWRERIPMGRPGEGREVIEAVLFLANEAEASFVNGEILRVDGGWTAYHLFHPFDKAF